MDVPNGVYRFVGAFGSSVEDGGSGPAGNLGPDNTVLVSNFDQTQYTVGEADPAKRGAGVYARVGFGGRIPPWGDGVSPDPQFIDMDDRGLPTSD